jgi:hypothetical protein
MVADPPREFLSQAIPGSKSCELNASIDKGVAENLIRVRVESTSNDFASFGFQLVKGAQLSERTASRPFQVVMTLSRERRNVLAQGISGTGANLFQI